MSKNGLNRALLREGFVPVPNTLIRSQKLTPLDKIIWILIASCEPSFPSYSALIEWTGCNSRTMIAKSLKRLEAASLIRRFKRINDNRVFYTTYIQKDYKNGAELVPGDSAPIEFQDLDSTRQKLST